MVVVRLRLFADIHFENGFAKVFECLNPANIVAMLWVFLNQTN